MSKIRILIADDHSIVREGLKQLLELEEDFEVVGQASNGVETIEKVEELKPDVLLLDINMP
ncbi:MAG TPA: response regulator transcription factor, partial [Clostridia bacterium]|nr:response regulator transcription factor [Clostridia bacterium]